MLLVSCNDQFVFDDMHADGPAAPDAGGAPDAPADAGDPPAAATCAVGSSACPCSGTQCSCEIRTWCWFNGGGCDATMGQCSFYCHNQSHCEGSCQHGCRLECEGGSICRLTLGSNGSVEADGAGTIAVVTVGPGSHVQCEEGAVCHVGCYGACALTCTSGARCDLTCLDDPAGATMPANTGGVCQGRI